MEGVVGAAVVTVVTAVTVAVPAISLKAGIARTIQSRAGFHSRNFSGFGFPYYDNAYYSCRTPVPNNYG